MFYNLKGKKIICFTFLYLFLFIFLIEFISALSGVIINPPSTTTSTSVTVLTGNLTTFLQLEDTPNSYVGAGEYCLKVNAGETAVEFVACGGGGDFSFTNFQDSFNLNATGLQYNFNQSNLKYEFNQSNLLYNFNQSAITYNFNQSNLDSVYTSLGTVQIVNNTIFFLNTTYSQFWFNQSDLDSVYAKVGEGGNVSWNETYAGELFVNITGDTMTGSLRFTNADLYIGGTAQGIYFNDTLDNAEFRAYSSTNIKMGFPSNRGANFEFYHMNDTTQPGNLIFVYGGNKSIGNVYFKQYNGSDWNNNFQLDTYGNLNILSNITSTYFIGNGSQLTGIQYNFNQSNLDSVYTSLGTLQIINDSVTFLNTTYNEWWFNQSDLPNLQWLFNQSELTYNFNQSDFTYVKVEVDPIWSANFTNMQITCSGNDKVSGIYGNGSFICSAVAGSGDFSFINFQDSFDLNYSDAQWSFNQSELTYNFNQSELTFNFNQSNLVYNFNQSNFAWQLTYNETYDTRITSVNSTVFFLNTTYSQWWFNQSNLNSVYELESEHFNASSMKNITCLNNGCTWFMNATDTCTYWASGGKDCGAA